MNLGKGWLVSGVYNLFYGWLLNLDEKAQIQVQGQQDWEAVWDVYIQESTKLSTINNLNTTQNQRLTKEITFSQLALAYEK